MESNQLSMGYLRTISEITTLILGNLKHRSVPIVWCIYIGFVDTGRPFAESYIQIYIQYLETKMKLGSAISVLATFILLLQVVDDKW